MNLRPLSLEPAIVPPVSIGAQLYAALHAGTPGDVAFYRRACQGVASVLEFGAGAGRISLALAQDGATVTGVELDAGMLALARQRTAALGSAQGWPLAVTFEQGDMATFECQATFERVLIPYSALWCLRGTEAKAQCLRNAYGCLAPGGQLILDVYDADVWAEDPGDVEPSDPGTALDDFEPLSSIVVDGESYRVWERSRWDDALREMHVEYRLRSRRDERDAEDQRPVWRLALTHSVLWRHELAALLDDCGFEVEWGVDEVDEGSDFAEQVVVRAHKS